MAYATIHDLEAGFRQLDADERVVATALLNEAEIIIDSYNSNASEDKKSVVSCRMVRRAIGDGNSLPLGATQGSMSAGGYTQSWTIGSSGSAGELYISKLEKKLLGYGARAGAYSPLEGLINND